MTDAVIVGGGLAGAATACWLAQAGRRVVLLERETAPVDKICGEFISGEAQMYLRRIGINLAGLGARPITRLRLVHGAGEVAVDLPFLGLGLSRRVLDEALLLHAAACGAEVRRGQVVDRIRTDAGIVAEISGQEDLAAQTLFLATGKHDCRGLRRRQAHLPDDLVGFKMHFCLDPTQLRALEGYVEVLMFGRGYGGLQCVEDGRANLCLVVDRSQLTRAGGHWEGLLDDLKRDQPHLRARLHGAVERMDRPLSIYRVPYGFVHVPRPNDPPDLFRLGDQVGVIPSFTGDGMAIALHSAAVASEVYLQGRPASEYHRRLHADVSPLIRRAAAMYRFAQWRYGRGALMTLARAWPRGLRLAASLTRVPPRALLRRSAIPIFLMLAGAAQAQAPSPAGLWRSYDDRTGRERGLIRIREEAGQLIGSITGTIDPAEAARTCDNCKGDRHGRPILGLTILTGLHRQGEGWAGGEIVDPETGSVYRCSLRLAKGGAELVLRGYIGIPLFGRTQTWRRVAP